ncbi:MAG: SPOR domain-containing protein, partial [Muribaculaceae bacterium]|nr:SPOR domain-containing protein [Muribaculaceae bacterium]
FRGLSPISTFKENNLYKYYYGESSDRSEMETLLKEVRKKIPDAFVVESKKTSH